MELAACAGMPIEAIFPVKGQTTARAILRSLQGQPECLDYARAYSDTMGNRRAHPWGTPERGPRD
jgi:hypothetical protein